ncbi:hypothetical protein LCGC14_2758990, partial [marine sediment metagenome]
MLMTEKITKLNDNELQIEQKPERDIVTKTYLEKR